MIHKLLICLVLTVLGYLLLRNVDNKTILNSVSLDSQLRLINAGYAYSCIYSNSKLKRASGEIFSTFRHPINFKILNIEFNNDIPTNILAKVNIPTCLYKGTKGLKHANERRAKEFNMWCDLFPEHPSINFFQLKSVFNHSPSRREDHVFLDETGILHELSYSNVPEYINIHMMNGGYFYQRESEFLSPLPSGYLPMGRDVGIDHIVGVLIKEASSVKHTCDQRRSDKGCIQAGRLIASGGALAMSCEGKIADCYRYALCEDGNLFYKTAVPK